MNGAITAALWIDGGRVAQARTRQISRIDQSAEVDAELLHDIVLHLHDRNLQQHLFPRLDTIILMTLFGALSPELLPHFQRTPLPLPFGVLPSLGDVRAGPVEEVGLASVQLMRRPKNAMTISRRAKHQWGSVCAVTQCASESGSM